jgi:hypothetical protein
MAAYPRPHLERVAGRLAGTVGRPRRPIRDAQQSADGDVLVFATDAALVWNDANAHSDIYRYDPHTDTLTLVSTGRAGRAADGPSRSPRLDGEGRHVIYLSTARDLVVEAGNEHAQIYHHDLGFGTTPADPHRRRPPRRRGQRPTAAGRPLGDLPHRRPGPRARRPRSLSPTPARRPARGGRPGRLGHPRPTGQPPHRRRRRR